MKKNKVKKENMYYEVNPMKEIKEKKNGRAFQNKFGFTITTI